MYLEQVCLLNAYLFKDLLSESSDVSIDEINSEYDEENNSNEIYNGRSNKKTKKLKTHK